MAEMSKRQENSITGSETQSADGRRRSVRQMRLRLLGAEGCFNQSLDHFSKLERKRDSVNET